MTLSYCSTPEFRLLVTEIEVFLWNGKKIQQTKIIKAELVYEGRLKVTLLLQVNSHDFEPNFIVFCLNWRIMQD